MLREGKHIYGDMVQVNNLTKGWIELDINPIELECRLDTIVRIANKSSGCFADLSDDIDACLRFELQEDADAFEAEYNAQEIV